MKPLQETPLNQVRLCQLLRPYLPRPVLFRIKPLSLSCVNVIAGLPLSRSLHSFREMMMNLALRMKHFTCRTFCPPSLLATKICKRIWWNTHGARSLRECLMRSSQKMAKLGILTFSPPTRNLIRMDCTIRSTKSLMSGGMDSHALARKPISQETNKRPGYVATYQD